MSFWDNVKKFAQPYADEEYDEYEEDEYEEYDEEEYEEDADVGLRGFVDAGGCVLDAVTHWRSLPDPPGGKHE